MNHITFILKHLASDSRIGHYVRIPFIDTNLIHNFLYKLHKIKFKFM